MSAVNGRMLFFLWVGIAAGNCTVAAFTKHWATAFERSYFQALPLVLVWLWIRQRARFLDRGEA